MKRVLCFGDSNTWGYISGTDHLRYNENERWTKLLHKKLGDQFEVIEEGLNSRTLFSDDNRPGKEGRNGFTYFKPCLDTHDKIDIIILMLGTNELKNSFDNSPQDIIDMLDKYVEFVQGYKSQIDGSSPALIVSGIPPVREATDYCSKGNKYLGASAKCAELNVLQKEHFMSKNVFYIDNTDLETGIDGVHITKDSHEKLAIKLKNFVMENFGN